MAEQRDRTVLLMILAVFAGLFLVGVFFVLGLGFFFVRSVDRAAPAPPVMVVPEEAPAAPVKEGPRAPTDDPPQKVPPPRKNIPTH